MIGAFYTAATGAVASQYNINVNANNIANINTTGFRAQRASFADLMYYAQGSTAAVTGTGARSASPDTVFTVGDPYLTDRSMDVTIDGKGFFAVQDANGNRYYTRNGNFSWSRQPDGKYALSTANGDYVLDSNLKKIVVDTPPEDPHFTTGAKTTDNIQLGVFTFRNDGGLMRMTDSGFTATALSGQPQKTDAKLMQGYLEGSNVDASTEMVNVMMSQRSFQLNAKLIQITDELEGMANSMKG